MPCDFWFSFALLGFLRFHRNRTLLGATVGTLLSLLVLWLHSVHCRWIVQPCIEPRVYYEWLHAAVWVNTLAGMRRRPLAICLLPTLSLFSFTLPGFLGLLTGAALNLPRPLKRSDAPKETYGIYRVSVRC